jgi:uncharacterized protein (TIGR02270 family)
MTASSVESQALGPGPSAKEFARSFYIEHLEETSFLYEQRLSLFDDPEITWLDIDDFEQRFEAHIDALVVGEGMALDVCRRQAIEGDSGELHAAVRVFCRQDHLNLLKKVLDEDDFEDEERFRAVVDALNHELPTSWQDEFIQVLSEGEEKFIPLAAEILGYKRLPVGMPLLKALQENQSEPYSKIIWALGRIREKGSRNLLLNYILHEDETICYASSLALLRMGETQTVDKCMGCLQDTEWPCIPVGLGGGRSNVACLIEIAASDRIKDVCLIALGLLGVSTAVDILIDHLTNEELAGSAAMAFNLITGAGLYEEVFISEEIDEDELFEEELERLKEGEPLYPPGEEPGTTITRLSQNPEVWDKWWSENKSRFDPEMRYRNGKPYSPACLLENLESEKSPRLVRQMAYEELVIRYGVDFPFETDMLVSQQKQAIAKYAEWIKANGSRFQAGKWYFAGQLMH